MYVQKKVDVRKGAHICMRASTSGAVCEAFGDGDAGIFFRAVIL